MKVFISYAFDDRDIMNILRKALRERGIDVYTAEHHLQLGRSLSTKIQNAIEDSDVVIALVTKHASSPSVNQEVGYAIRSHIPVIPMVEEGARVGFMIGDVEQMRWNRSGLYKACEKVAEYVDKEFGSGGREEPEALYDETKIIGPDEYEDYWLDLEEDEKLTGKVTSDLAVDVYIMNRRNFEYFEDGDDFDFVGGSEGVTRFTVNFPCPKRGKWVLVISNPNDEEAEVDVLIKGA